MSPGLPLHTANYYTNNTRPPPPPGGGGGGGGGGGPGLHLHTALQHYTIIMAWSHLHVKACPVRASGQVQDNASTFAKLSGTCLSCGSYMVYMAVTGYMTSSCLWKSPCKALTRHTDVKMWPWCKTFISIEECRVQYPEEEKEEVHVPPNIENLGCKSAKSPTASIQGSLKSPRSSRFRLLSHAIWALFWRILIQNGTQKQKQSWSKWGGGGGGVHLLCPAWISHCYLLVIGWQLDNDMCVNKQKVHWYAGLGMVVLSMILFSS